MSEILVPPVRIGPSAVGALGMLVVAICALESVVAPALPLLQSELAISPAGGALISIAVLITGAVITPIAGKLGDRYGGKRVLVRLMVVVSVGGLLSALAPNLPALLLGQVMQGAMLGALPLSFVLVRKYLPPGQSKVAIGLVTGLFVGGGMVGTLMAGPVAEGLSRHWMFALPTIAIMAMTLIVHILVPHDPPARVDTRIDWPGAVLLSSTLIALMLGLAMAPLASTQPLVVGAIAAVVAVLATGWVVVERRVAAPLVDLRMLATPGMWSSCVIAFVIAISYAVVVYLIPQLFAVSADGYGFGASATDIGRYLLPGIMAAAVGGPVSGLAARRFGSRAVVLAGIVVMAATLIALVWLHTAAWHLIVAKMLIAFAGGIITTALFTGTATAVDQSDTGIATGLVLVVRVIGTAVGVQVSGAILTVGAHPVSGFPTESAFVTGFVIAGVATALSLFAIPAMVKDAQA